MSLDQFLLCLFLSREGGLLLAVPVASFASNALDAGQREDENSVLGPSFVTGASMVEESETGEIVAVDSYPIDVLLIDVTDSFLGAVRGYDPAGDAGADIMPFDEEYPAALPLTSVLVTAARSWIATQADGRANFYSAREELDTPVIPSKPKTPAKKAAAKKMTNAALAEQVAALANQVQALTALHTSAAAREVTYLDVRLGL